MQHKASPIDHRRLVWRARPQQHDGAGCPLCSRRGAAFGCSAPRGSAACWAFAGRQGGRGSACVPHGSLSNSQWASESARRPTTPRAPTLLLVDVERALQPPVHPFGQAALWGQPPAQHHDGVIVTLHVLPVLQPAARAARPRRRRAVAARGRMLRPRRQPPPCGGRCRPGAWPPERRTLRGQAWQLVVGQGRKGARLGCACGPGPGGAPAAQPAGSTARAARRPALCGARELGAAAVGATPGGLCEIKRVDQLGRRDLQGQEG